MQRLQLVKSHLIQNNSASDSNSTSNKNFIAKHLTNLSVVQLDRPEAMNAITLPMIIEIMRTLDYWNTNENIKACIWKGNGTAFCAGGDLIIWRKLGDQKEYEMIDLVHWLCAYMLSRIKNMRPIQVSIWDGYVMGAGVGLSINSKIRIATDTTLFAMPECQVGYFADSATAYYFPRIKKHIGLYLGLTGSGVTGKQAYSLGLADYFVPSDKLKDLEDELVRVVDAGVTLEKLRKVIEKYSDSTKEPFENEDEIERLFGKNTLKEIFQELERKSGSSEFAKKTFLRLQKCCPKSLRIVFEEQQRGKKLDVNQVMEMDYRLVKLMKENDFQEGVEARLLSKGKKPNWTYKTIDIPDDVIQSYFTPRDKYMLIDFANIK